MRNRIVTELLRPKASPSINFNTLWLKICPTPLEIACEKPGDVDAPVRLSKDRTIDEPLYEFFLRYEAHKEKLVRPQCKLIHEKTYQKVQGHIS